MMLTSIPFFREVIVMSSAANGAATQTTRFSLRGRLDVRIRFILLLHPPNMKFLRQLKAPVHSQSPQLW